MINHLSRRLDLDFAISTFLFLLGITIILTNLAMYQKVNFAKFKKFALSLFIIVDRRENVRRSTERERVKAIHSVMNLMQIPKYIIVSNTLTMIVDLSDQTITMFAKNAWVCGINQFHKEGKLQNSVQGHWQTG